MEIFFFLFPKKCIDCIPNEENYAPEFLFNTIILQVFLYFSSMAGFWLKSCPVHIA